MPWVGYDEAAEARRRAEEEARKEKKRRELRAKINGLKDDLSGVEGIKLRLEKEMYYLGRKMDEWEVHKNRCKGNLLLSEVVILNRFEGVCADKIKQDFTASVMEMNNTYLKTGRLLEDGDIQIQRLNQYISSLNDRIESLTRELNSI